MNKKTLFFLTAISISSITFGSPQVVTEHLIQNITCDIVSPTSLEELVGYVKHAKGPLAIAGVQASQGEHVWAPFGTTLDMSKMNRIEHFDLKTKTITVQAGIQWKDIQAFLVPYGLTVMTMQSYNDFSVGGSLSVNVHGRMLDGSIINSVIALKVLLADGSLVTATRTEHSELFQAVIGGYGACGIIVEATLQLADNDHIERVVHHMSLSDYKKYFMTHIARNPNVVLHNANVVLPECGTIESITWCKTIKPLTISDSLQPSTVIIKEALMRKYLERIPFSQHIRAYIEKKYSKSEFVCWRSYEMSYGIASLKAFNTTLFKNILQEYFIPTDYFELFFKRLHTVLKNHGVNTLNISIRYVPGNTESILSYAPKDCFAFVLYINIPGSQHGYATAKKWTQELITHALSCHGTYYLPYALFATQQQFEKAYPRHEEFKTLRQKYDPNKRFGNTFLNTYLI